MLELHKTKAQLEALVKRPDIDTICALNYVRMKKHALQGDGLQYQDYHPEYKGIKVPNLWKKAPA